MRSQFKTACLTTASRPVLSRLIEQQMGPKAVAESDARLIEYAGKLLSR